LKAVKSAMTYAMGGLFPTYTVSMSDISFQC